ncbi:PQQ-dependent sugar dehydrogenase [Shimia litoralis]|uniref:PQQ-dependent sugar dehydrogenase n=1 Tax=Shimia litoralis TaxID=420403 RepID=A0A4U7MVK2_9RHOB|nr:PQQ-dependent sugar dehydrogenase [Shimia litoralis]TKZ17170.1 PQQ-dependent sugar dehydrogenase [Shimia litoralis]
MTHWRFRKAAILTSLVLVVLCLMEFWLPNYVSRFSKRIAVDLGISDGRDRTRYAQGTHWESNDFLFSFVPVEGTETQRVAGVLRVDDPKQFVVVDQQADTIEGYQLGALLAANGYSIAVKNSGGIKQIIEVEGALFALVSLQHEECVFAGLVDLSAMRMADKFPCFPEVENELSFNGIGGGYTTKDGFLYVSIGTAANRGTDAHSQLAQDPKSPFGKTLRYKIVRTPTGVQLEDREMFSLGHRNPQGMMTFDDLILSVEHGPKGGDELNIIDQNRNYGWPYYSMGSEYNDEPIPGTAPVGEGMTDPVYAFVPSIGISDISHCPEILAKYYEGLDCVLISSLRAKSFYIVLGHLKDRKVLSIEKIEVQGRVREMFLQDELLFLVTDFGNVIRVDIETLAGSH